MFWQILSHVGSMTSHFWLKVVCSDISSEPSAILWWKIALGCVESPSIVGDVITAVLELTPFEQPGTECPFVSPTKSFLIAVQQLIEERWKQSVDRDAKYQLGVGALREKARKAPFEAS